MATANLRFRIIGDDDASATFLKVAAAADIASNAMGKWTRIGLGAASVTPVIAATAASLVELSTAAAAGAGALGIFGLSVFGIGKDMIDAQTKIAAAQKKLDGLTKGTAEYKAALKDLHSQQSDFNKQFGPAAKGMRDVRTAFSEFKNATSKVTTNVMGKAFELLANVLPKLAPVANAAGHAVGGLIDDLSKWTKSPAFKGLLHWFETSGPKAITHFGHSVGNILSGLGGILKNFVKPGDKAAKSLQQLTKRFAEWGHSKGVSDSVKQFLAYVHDNGPNISSVISSLADVLPKVAVAMGQLGSLQLTAISMFLQLLAKMPQRAFNIVVTGMFGIVAASKALAIIDGLTFIFTAFKDALILTRIQLGLLLVQEKLAAAAAKVMAAMQWLLNAAMDANPITLVVLAIAALVAGFIYAYKHSETFRKIVDGALRGIAAAGKWMWDNVLKPTFHYFVAALQELGKWGKWLWNSIFQPVFHFIADGIATLLSLWAGMLHALSHVPGFGWAGDLANKLDAAAGKAHSLADAINKIPDSHSVAVVINVVRGITYTTGGHTQREPSSGHGGAGTGAGEVGRSIGKDLMDGIMAGIAGRQLSLQTALDKVTALIQTMGTKISNQLSKISNLQGVRSGFAGTFTGTSIFGTDLSTTTQDAAGNDVTTPATIADLIAFQKKQARQAHRLAHDVREATKRGLSKALIKQLQAQGTAGAATLHEIVQGSGADIRRLNRLNKQTSDSLRHAGMTAGNFVRGGSINADIKHAVKQEHLLERQENTLQRLEHHLKDIAHSQKKDQTIVVEIDGEAVVRSIVRRNKRKGVKTAGV